MEIEMISLTTNADKYMKNLHAFFNLEYVEGDATG